MKRFLLIYDTGEGQTRVISQFIQKQLEKHGEEVAAFPLKRFREEGLFLSSDAILIGGSVHMGKHSGRLMEFLRKHRAALAEKPSGLFSVSLSAAGDESERKQAEEYVTQLLEQVRWQPDRAVTFPGALRYRDYGFMKRWIMKKIAADTGKETDTSKNHVFTDWGDVEAFVEDFRTCVESDRGESH